MFTVILSRCVFCTKLLYSACHIQEKCRELHSDFNLLFIDQGLCQQGWKQNWGRPTRWKNRVGFSQKQRHFTAELVLLCLKWQKRIDQQLLLIAISTAAKNRASALIVIYYQWCVLIKCGLIPISAVMEWDRKNFLRWWVVILSVCSCVLYMYCPSRGHAILVIAG